MYLFGYQTQTYCVFDTCHSLEEKEKEKEKKRGFLMGEELNPFGKYYKGYNFC